MYNIAFHPNFQSILDKLKAKDPKSYNNVLTKIKQIATTLEFKPKHYKNLKSPMQEYKRAHVNTHFVIIFKVDETNKTVTLFNYKHHDFIYK